MNWTEAKDQVAEKYGCLDWDDLVNSPIEDDEEIISKLNQEAAELYARSMAAQAWEDAIKDYEKINNINVSYYDEPTNPYKP